MRKPLILFIIFATAPTLLSQNAYKLNQFVIANGGINRALNSNYSLSATVGEFSVNVMQNNLYRSYFRFFPILLVTDIGLSDVAPELPRYYDLLQNFPNPFNPVTVIKYMLPYHSDVQLDVFNLLGQHVIKLKNGQQAPGLYLIRWDGKNRYGQSVASGEYFYLIQAKATTGEIFKKTKKMVLLK